MLPMMTSWPMATPAASWHTGASNPGRHTAPVREDPDCEKESHGQHSTGPVSGENQMGPEGKKMRPRRLPPKSSSIPVALPSATDPLGLLAMRMKRYLSQKYSAMLTTRAKKQTGGKTANEPMSRNSRQAISRYSSVISMGAWSTELTRILLPDPKLDSDFHIMATVKSPSTRLLTVSSMRKEMRNWDPMRPEMQLKKGASAK
mmetsp:Transcript_64096/g.171630  ORF Transcript_64096/g.171630 Transcript_64096/m.171630 type:complete len:203 (+) Transcript_64096:208-816(+)